MEPIQTIAILSTLAAAFAYLNHRFLKMPMTIGLMFLSLASALLLILLSAMGLPVKAYADELVRSIDFSKVLLDSMLGLLLFAGALHVNLNDLAERSLEVGVFATLGVLASTVLVGGTLYYVCPWFGLDLRLIDTMLFGALISPTDPIAVLGIMKKARAPRDLEIKIAGESLFNDGFGVVVFLVLLEMAVGQVHITPQHVAGLFLQEALGGIVFGLTAGFLAYLVLKSINQSQVEVMVTLALVLGGYALADSLHVSAPLSMVAAGLLIGNQGRRLAMSDDTREHLDTFWELVDAILNALLFVLIGLEVLVLTTTGRYLLAGALAIPVALAARLVSVGLPIGLLSRWRKFSPGALSIMTWGGLRGGISVALALTIPDGHNRELFLTMTYAVVAFSILVQGLTIRSLVQRTNRQ